MSKVCQVEGELLGVQGYGVLQYEMPTFVLSLSIVSSILPVLMATVGSVGPSVLSKGRVIGVSLDMFLQILRPLEGFATKVASVWLQRYVNTDV